MVYVEIVDTGPGITEKDQKTLFKKFGRVKNYTNEKGRMTQIVRPGGTGLGLYLVKGVITLHGGEIGVESKQGEGATFWFTLPRHRILHNDTSGGIADDSIRTFDNTAD